MMDDEPSLPAKGGGHHDQETPVPNGQHQSLPVLRPGRDADSDAIIALIWSCWSRHPGIRMDVDREMPELRAPATYYTGQGGRLWLAEGGNRVTGMIATKPEGNGTWEICRVYVDPALHGGGLGHALLDAAERHAIAAGATRLILFTDTRFDRAHHFYEKRCFVRHGPIRVLHDISNSLEYGYAKPVHAVMMLDIAAATSAIRPLADVLTGCVKQGGAGGFLPPLAPDRATGFLRALASAVGIGTRVLAAAWRNGVIVGFGWLATDVPDDQPERVNLATILVHPSVRRQGAGRSIAGALQSEAQRLGRPLLTATVPATPDAQAFATALGWHQAGRIPGFSRNAEGAARDAIVAWKRLG